MTLKVTILAATCRENKGLAKAPPHNPYHMFFQTAYVHTFDKNTLAPNPYPEKLEITLDTTGTIKDGNVQPVILAPGEYELHPASFYVGKFGLEVAPKLTPLTQKKTT